MTEAEIDESLATLLRTRFKLGLFDPEELNPYTAISMEVVNSAEHRALAREAAVKSLVLLKNADGLLPLARDLRKIYVTGPLAADAAVLLANYHGVSSDLSTILEGIVGAAGSTTLVTYRQGSLLDRPNLNPMDWYSGVAAESDVTIAVVGISNLLEGEEGAAIASPGKGDRFDLHLPQNQIDFLTRLRERAKKLVVVLLGGSPMAIPEVHEMADAVLLAWYPGEEGGRAVADVIFGDESPSGRVPITFPVSLDQLPPYEDYSMAGRTYRYMTEEPLYPFGFGLSYASFSYGEISLDRDSIEGGGDRDRERESDEHEQHPGRGGHSALHHRSRGLRGRPDRVTRGLPARVHRTGWERGRELHHHSGSARDRQQRRRASPRSGPIRRDHRRRLARKPGRHPWRAGAGARHFQSEVRPALD